MNQGNWKCNGGKGHVMFLTFNFLFTLLVFIFLLCVILIYINIIYTLPSTTFSVMDHVTLKIEAMAYENVALPSQGYFKTITNNNNI